MKVIVVGGGIIGSSIAWRLAREGATVTLLERARLGQEASWAAAGLIAPQAEAQGAGAFFELCLRAREAFREINPCLIEESGIDPEYGPMGILYLALDRSDQAELEARARWQRQAGGVLEELTPAEARKFEPAIGHDTLYALYMPEDRPLDNRKLTQAYAVAAVRAGAILSEGASVEAILTTGGRANGVQLHDGSSLEADLVVIAAGAWSHMLRGLEADHVTVHPVRGQIACFEGRPSLLGPPVFSSRGYLVPRRDGRVLAGSTMEQAGFNRSVTLAGIERIVSAALTIVPALSNLAFREAWAGLRPATRDLMPVLGFSPSVPNVIYASGHFRSGILLSALTGEIVADLVAGRQSTVDLNPFSPARFGTEPSS
ncbi:MAG TPA: glycine oxidase ThiO [Candidatus Binataceae bacterium]|nr:glycine oxidase ThiO [Candidatus Binataceae bacterium]